MPVGVKTVREPQPGETRDCLDPWKMAFVHADGAVTLCCWSRPVGNVKQAPLQEILHNEASVALRRGLLEGALPADCVQCPARMLTPVADFRRKVEGWLNGSDREELLKARARLHAVHLDLAAARRRTRELDSELASVRQHAANLEEVRGHLERHNAELQAFLDAWTAGRTPAARLVGVWLRGRLRRWFGMRAASGA